MATRLEESPARPDARLEPAFAAIESGELRVLSVDVFDTMLFRRVPEPADPFPLIGARLAERGALTPGTTPAVFARVRHAAERRARDRSRELGRGPEVTLGQIHAELPRSVFARAVDPAELAEVECAVESELLVPDLDVVALMREAQERGLLVVAASDTYFSERQLRLFIARGPLASIRLDRVFASSHHGAGKAGGLFSVMLEDLGCRPDELLHVGDNHQSDVAAPGRLGIRTVYFERRPPELARILERERIQLPEDVDRPRDGALTALRGKVLHQTEGTSQPAGLRPFWNFGAASLGPAFTGFAEWVQEEAARAGASRVFCLMREGELLARLVNGARPADASGVPAERFWLSRQVCARASVLEGSVEELRRLVARRDTPTLRELCGTLGLRLADLPGLAEHGDRRIADHGLGDEVIDLVAFDPDLRERVVASSQALRRRLLRYIEQHRPAGEPRLVLVDLGWGATIQATVEQLLREGGIDCTTVGLYLLTHHVALHRALDGVEIHGYLGEFGVPDGPVAAIRRSPEILEQVCMPDSGSQVDLTEELAPVLADAEARPLQSVERAAVQQGVLAFQRAWTRYRSAVPGSLDSLTGELRPQLLAMVARAVVAPTADEAALFAGWMHDENFGSARVESITAGPAVRALRYLDPQALTKIPMTELYWPFGLAALHDEHLAGSVAAASGGLLPWDAFSSPLELGDFEVRGDLGWGFDAEPESAPSPRRNRRGLSYARATIRGDFVQRVQVRPASHPCILRIDWIRLRCRVHGRPEPVTVDLREPGDFGRLRVAGARWIAPQLLLVSGERPRLVLDLRRLVDGRVYDVVVELAFAGLPLARSRSGERLARTRAALRRLAKETWLGAPLRLARRLLRRPSG